jgi:hypothetical protein
MMNESKIPLIRKTLRKGKKTGMFTGEVESETIKFRYEIYGVRYDKTWDDLSFNVRVYNCEYRSWVGSKWNKKGEGWRNAESINRNIRNEIRNEWNLFFTSTFDIPSYQFNIGNIKHMIQP